MIVAWPRDSRSRRRTRLVVVPREIGMVTKFPREVRVSDTASSHLGPMATGREGQPDHACRIRRRRKIARLTVA